MILDIIKDSTHLEKILRISLSHGIGGKKTLILSTNSSTTDAFSIAAYPVIIISLNTLNDFDQVHIKTFCVELPIFSGAFTF